MAFWYALWSSPFLNCGRPSLLHPFRRLNNYVLLISPTTITVMIGITSWSDVKFCANSLLLPHNILRRWGLNLPLNHFLKIVDFVWSNWICLLLLQCVQTKGKSLSRNPISAPAKNENICDEYGVLNTITYVCYQAHWRSAPGGCSCAPLLQCIQINSEATVN